MQATDFGNRDDRAKLQRLDRSWLGRVLVEGQVGADAVIVREVAGQDTAVVMVAEHHHHMVQTLSPDGANEALAERIRPRALGRREEFRPFTQRRNGRPKTWSRSRSRYGGGIVREGVDDLLGGPRHGRALGDVEVRHAPPVMGEDEQQEAPASARSAP
jgi:hypothetical protein